MQVVRLVARGPYRAKLLDYSMRALFLVQVLVCLHARPVDIIYIRDPSLLYLLRRLPSVLRPKSWLIYEAHKIYHRVSTRVRSAHGELSVIGLADRVVAVSPGVEGGLLRLGVDPQKLEVIPLGVKLPAYQRPVDVEAIRGDLGLDARAVVVTYAGSWDEWKGVDDLIRAFARLPRSRGECVLALLGANEAAFTRTQRLLDELKISPEDYILWGHVARATLIDFMLASDIGVLPNRDTLLSGLYTSPLKAFEYLAAGLSIVAADLPALRAVLSEAEALFYEPADVDELAKKLQMLINSQSLRERCRRAALHLAPLYDYGRRAARIEKIYHELAKPRESRDSLSRQNPVTKVEDL